MTDLFPASDDDGAPTRRDRRRRPHRSRQRRRRNIISFLVMVLALVLLVGGAVVFIRPLLDQPDAESTDFDGPGGGEVEVAIPDGASGASIGDSLVDAGVVKTSDAFTAAYSSNPNATSIQAGTYELQEGMRAVDAVAALLDPARRSDLRLTVPEGWTVEQINTRLADLLDVSTDEVEDAGDELAADELPDAADGSLEGWLFASTYTLEEDDTPRDVLEQMLDLTIDTLDDRDVAKKQREDVIIKASIVEKEVPDEYWDQAARVIENRLDGCSEDSKLGMDTTYVYRLGKKANDITEDEWKQDDPYNGRKVEGLPPTPIGAPSEGAIDAVLDPPQGDWCYFVTVNLETEETVFSDTLEEHEKHQQQYRDWLEEQSDEMSEEGDGDD